MLKKSASSVLASLKRSTYRNVPLAVSLAAALPVERRVLARQGCAGENDSPFEHPEDTPSLSTVREDPTLLLESTSFSAPC